MTTSPCTALPPAPPASREAVASPPAIIIRVKHTGRGLFDAFDDTKRLLVRSSRTPFFDSARVLLAEGVNPDTHLAMLMNGTPSLSSTVGHAAALTVSEGATYGPRIAKFRPFERASLQIPAPSEPAEFSPRTNDGAQ